MSLFLLLLLLLMLRLLLVLELLLLMLTLLMLTLLMIELLLMGRLIILCCVAIFVKWRSFGCSTRLWGRLLPRRCCSS